jgi:hypothetical protein
MGRLLHSGIVGTAYIADNGIDRIFKKGILVLVGRFKHAGKHFDAFLACCGHFTDDFII